MVNTGGAIRPSYRGWAFMGFIAVVLVYFFFGGGGGGSGVPSAGRSGTVSLKSVLAASIEVAKRGGNEVKRIRELANIGEKSKGETKEGANNPVTDGDMLSHRQMYHGLKKTFPEVNIISEEDDPEAISLSTIADISLSNAEVDSIVSKDSLVPVGDVDVWIDPLDATQEYTENLQQYVTTMVCVAVKGQPTIGVIHKPFDGVTAWAWAGPNYLSKSVQGEQKALAEKLGGDVHQHQNDLSKTRIIVSRSHKGSVLSVANEAFGKDSAVKGAGGAGYKAWEVAKGNQDVYIHTTLIKKWDICPGAALLKAVGGRLSALDGNDIDYSGKPLEVKNEGGVLATMHDHQSYIDKLKGAKGQ